MTTMNHTPDIQEILLLAQRAGVRLVRISYCDNAGLMRTKAVYIDDLPARMKSGIGFPLAQQALSAFDEPAPVEGLGPVGEFRLVPDPATFVVLPYVGETARACPERLLKRLDAFGRSLWRFQSFRQVFGS
jgi:glutamine synthetase